MRASRLQSAISRLLNVLEWSIKAQNEDLNVNFHISNEGVYSLKIQFSQLKENVCEESYLDLEMS